MNYICRLVNDVPDICIAEVRVAAGTTLRAGNVIVAENLDSGIASNYKVYVPGTVADVTTEEIAVVLGNDTFYTLANGMRIDGIPDYTQYEYQAGEVVKVVRLNVANIKLEISKDALAVGANVEVGGKLIPVNATKTFAYESQSVLTTALNYLKVEGKRNFRLGGQFGADTAETYIVRSSVLVIPDTVTV